MNRVFLVIETKSSKDLRFRGIGGADFLAPMDHAVGLIEVRCASYLGRNHAIIRAETLHAVDLNGRRTGIPCFSSSRAISTIAEPPRL